MEEKTLTQEEVWEIAEPMIPTWQLQNEIGFGDCPYPAPEIEFAMDKTSFYSSSDKRIHIGLDGARTMFGPKTQEDLVSAVSYLRQHEEQHCRSTAAKPYAWAVNRGTEIVIEEIAKLAGKHPFRFRAHSDYRRYVESVLPTYGIGISYQLIVQTAASIANSLEDGRIERIRGYRFPGFASLRTRFRGLFYLSGENTYPDAAASLADPSSHLAIVLNNVLTLATCQKYQMGFILSYGGTVIQKEVDALMPDIWKGVMAPRTRDMAAASVDICRQMAPLIYEAAKQAGTDKTANDALADLISAVISSIMRGMPDDTSLGGETDELSGGLSEANEDTADEDGMDAALPSPDLVVTLPDDVFDKLAARSKKTSKKGNLTFIREHPLPEEQEDKEDDQEGASGAGGSGASGQKEDTEKQTKNGSGSGAGTPGSEPGSGSESGVSSGQNEPGSGSRTPDAESSSAEGQDADGVDGQGGQTGGGEHNASCHGKPLPADDKDRTPDTARTASSEGTHSGPSDAAEVMRAMKEAASRTNAAAKDDISTVNQGRAHEHSVSRGTDVVDNHDEPVSGKFVTDIMNGSGYNFKEYRREYRVSDPLPPVLKARGRALHRKNERYFRSLSTPNISYLDSGSIDPSRIFGLSMGDTDIFRKLGKDKHFNGCAYILLDNSGSMDGCKRTEACKAAAVIEESFKGLIPIKIVAFDCWDTVNHEVIKGWNERQLQNCCWNFCLHGRSGCGNADAYDIGVAAKELLSRPEQKKMLVVLSDGQPTEASVAETKAAIDAARKKGVQVSGIYFEEGRIGRDAGTFRHMYGKEHGICVTTKEIDAELEKLFYKFSRS